MGIATNEVSSAVKQLSDGNSVGTVLGQSASDKIAFHNATPSAQDSGPDQTAVARGQAGGTVAVMSSQQSPSAVNNITTSEKGLTLMGTTSSFQIAAGDVLFINKPTSQAGLGVGNIRVSAANVAGVTFSNFTAATITPTATQNYGVVAIRGFQSFSATLSPAAVGPNAIVEQSFTVAGVRAGSKALTQVSKPTAQAGLDIVGVRTISDNTVGVSFANVTAATITPTASESYTFFEIGGMDAQNNDIVIESVQSPAACANATSAEQGLTVTGLLASDLVVGVSKPTAQAGLGIAGWRVSAADTLGLTFGNYTAATITPTASQVYGVKIHRMNPAAPLVVYSQTLTPVSVAANTTAEQTFTVTGLVAGSPVWVNKPSWQSGLGIAGVRVSAANTLAINFCNASAAAITPTSEAYVIGNFQQPIPDVGGAWVQSACFVGTANSILANAMRTALTQKGLIAGA